MSRITRAKAAELAGQVHSVADMLAKVADDKGSNICSPDRLPLTEIAMNAECNRLGGERYLAQEIGTKKATLNENNQNNGRAVKRSTTPKVVDTSGSPRPDHRSTNANVDHDSFANNSTSCLSQTISSNHRESTTFMVTNTAKENCVPNSSQSEVLHLPRDDIKSNSSPLNVYRSTNNRLGENKEVHSFRQGITDKVEPKSLQNDVQLRDRFSHSPKLAGVEPLPRSDTTLPTSPSTPLKHVSVNLARTSQIYSSNDSNSFTVTPCKFQDSSSHSTSKTSGSSTATGMDLVNTTRTPRSLSASQSTSYDELEHAVVQGHTATPERYHTASTPRFEPDPEAELETEHESKSQRKSRDQLVQISAPQFDQRPELHAEEPTEVETESAASAMDPIAALDELEEAVDLVTAELPDLPMTPQKPASAKKEKSTPIVRTTKASMARISLAHGPMNGPQRPALGRPRQSNIGPTASASRVISGPSASSNGSDSGVVEKKDVVIPHSKPRPMSMVFPAPPPPVKSTKAVTTSTFQLPGEAVAAKLKAAKEARLAEEAERNKKQPFKARPVPASMHRPAEVRHTHKSKARESIIGMKMTSENDAVGSRANSVMGFSGPGSTTRKASSPPLSKLATLNAPRPSSSMSNVSVQTTTASRRLSTQQRPKQPQHQAVSQPQEPPRSRGMTVNSTSSSSALSAATSTSTAPPLTAVTNKGKAVFDRIAQAKEAAEREKREKEEAARRAREEAAERSRALSREWAEKQRLKVAAAAAAAAAAEEQTQSPGAVSPQSVAV